jgi:hypothetical protein
VFCDVLSYPSHPPIKLLMNSSCSCCSVTTIPNIPGTLPSSSCIDLWLHQCFPSLKHLAAVLLYEGLGVGHRGGQCDDHCPYWTCSHSASASGGVWGCAVCAGCILQGSKRHYGEWALSVRLSVCPSLLLMSTLPCCTIHLLFVVVRDIPMKYYSILILTLPSSLCPGVQRGNEELYCCHTAAMSLSLRILSFWTAHAGDGEVLSAEPISVNHSTICILSTPCAALYCSEDIVFNVCFS